MTEERFFLVVMDVNEVDSSLMINSIIYHEDCMVVARIQGIFCVCNWFKSMSYMGITKLLLEYGDTESKALKGWTPYGQHPYLLASIRRNTAVLRCQSFISKVLTVLLIPCRILDLADCRGLSAASLRTILCSSPNLDQLEALALDSIAEVDDQLISEICSGLPQLRRLSLKFCSLITDIG